MAPRSQAQKGMHGPRRGQQSSTASSPLRLEPSSRSASSASSAPAEAQRAAEAADCEFLHDAGGEERAASSGNPLAVPSRGGAAAAGYDAPGGRSVARMFTSPPPTVPRRRRQQLTIVTGADTVSTTTQHSWQVPSEYPFMVSPDCSPLTAVGFDPPVKTSEAADSNARSQGLTVTVDEGSPESTEFAQAQSPHRRCRPSPLLPAGSPRGRVVEVHRSSAGSALGQPPLPTPGGACWQSRGSDATSRRARSLWSHASGARHSQSMSSLRTARVSEVSMQMSPQRSSSQATTVVAGDQFGRENSGSSLSPSVSENTSQSPSVAPAPQHAQQESSPSLLTLGPQETPPSVLATLVHSRDLRQGSINSQDSLLQLVEASLQTQRSSVSQATRPLSAPASASATRSSSSPSRCDSLGTVLRVPPDWPSAEALFGDLLADSTIDCAAEAYVVRPRHHLQRWFLSRKKPLRLKLLVAFAPMAVLLFALTGLTVAAHREHLSYVLGVCAALFAVATFTVVTVSCYVRATSVQQWRLSVELQRRAAVEVSCARFIPAEFLTLLRYKSISKVEAGVRKTTEIAVMFIHLRDFLLLSEDPAAMCAAFDALSAVTARLTPIVRSHGGFVDKYLGDGMMALFPQREGSVLAAQQMQLGVEPLRERGGLSILSIGIHFGEVCVGTLGDATRLDTTTISSVVNFASRFEGLAKYYGSRLVVSDAVLACASVPQGLRRCLGRVQVKGSSEGHLLYDLFATDSPEERRVKAETVAPFTRALRHYARRQWADALEQLRICAVSASTFTQIPQSRGDPLDRAVATKVYFCRRYRDHGVPYAEWCGEDVWDCK